ncbi:MAG: glycoside hydrolase family 30 protein [Caulobacteraceae bacterium]
MSSSRRDLLVAAAASTLPGFLSTAGTAAELKAEPSAVISVLVTSAAGDRFTAHPPLSWRRKRRGETASLTAYPRDQRQTLQGFGAALTEAACTVLHRMPDPARARLLTELYGPGGLGLSMGRLCIGASDYTTELYSYDEGAPDPELARFSIAHDRTAVLPMVKAVLGVQPNLFLFASPWSPPGWMKYSGTMKGGTIRPQNLPIYANYIGRYLDAYRAEGVPIRAVTIQNETDADQAGRMAACSWAQQTEDDYIALLSPELKARGDVKLWILDHNYDLWGRVLDQLDKPEVRAVVDAVAWHGYKGDPAKMTLVHAAHPEIGAHWTEGGAMYDDPDYMTGWAKWATTIAGILNNRAQSVTMWNLALDEAGKPNIGPFTCGGLVTVRSDTQAVERSALYYAMGHYAKALRPGDRIMHTTSSQDELSCSGAVSPTGRTSVVVSNPGPARRLSLAIDDQAADWLAPADSVTTLSWQAATIG